MQRDVDLRGMVMPNTPPEELASIHAALVAGLENGTLRPVIGKEFPLTEAAQAHRAVERLGKSCQGRKVGRRKAGSRNIRRQRSESRGQKAEGSDQKSRAAYNES
jgi:hypothetical protein